MTLKNERITVKKVLAVLFLHKAQVKLQWFLLGCIRSFPVPVTSNCDRNISSLFISHDIFPFCIVADICMFTISWFLFYTFSSTNFSKSVLSKIGKLTANKSVNFEKDHSCSDTCNFPLLQCLNRLFHSSILVSHCVWQCIILIRKFM